MVRQRDRWNFKFQNVAATPLLQITGAKSQIIKLPVLQNLRELTSLCFCVHVKSLILIRSRDLLRVVIWIIDLASSCYLEVLLVPSRLLVKGAFNFNRRCIIGSTFFFGWTARAFSDQALEHLISKLAGRAAPIGNCTHSEAPVSPNWKSKHGYTSWEPFRLNSAQAQTRADFCQRRVKKTERLQFTWLFHEGPKSRMKYMREGPTPDFWMSMG